MGEIIPYLSRKANEKVEIIRHDEDSVELFTVMRWEEVKISERKTIDHERQIGFLRRT